MQLDDRTFFDAFEELCRVRRRHKLSAKDFLKGLLDVMKALNIYLKAESERISDDEIKLQIPILLGAIEAIKVFTKDYLNLQGNGMSLYAELKEKRKKGEISLRDFYHGLIDVVVRQAQYLYDHDIDEREIRKIIPMFMAFLRYFYHYFEEV
ncbi:MAG: hypothetical protein GXN97_06160 [Aquificae bacterium]|jgi:hypothetical protein|nr:hypothetical protein [Aquificota bacterium]